MGGRDVIFPGSYRMSVFNQARAVELLRTGSGNSAAYFRDGQLEAIQAVCEEASRVLVVQKTGWGKSFVYFISTLLYREAGRGPALLISPLLSLMRNQVAAAERMGLRAATVNLENLHHWQQIESHGRQRLGQGATGFRVPWGGQRHQGPGQAGLIGAGCPAPAGAQASCSRSAARAAFALCVHLAMNRYSVGK
jgi:hypothetical protein